VKHTKLRQEEIIAIMLCLFILAILTFGLNETTNFIYAGF